MKFALFAALAGAAAFATPANAQRAQITPYIEVNEVISAELSGDSDILTYTSLAVGADASVQTRRVQAQISYRYERRFGTSGSLSSQSVHSGLASARYNLNRNVALEAGALATRSRTDFEGDSPGLAFADSSNLSQVYAVYGGPSVSGNVGGVALNGSYRLAYVAVDANDDLVVPGPRDQRRRFDSYNDSVSHQVTASAGMSPGRLPFGWTVGGAYIREDVDTLNQRFEGAFIRGDVVVPVSQTFALTAGVGYESLKSSQQDFLRGTNGLPLIDSRGNLIEDRARPRLRGVDIDGVIYDGGFIWTPTRRTELQLRAGHRYGGTSVTGSLRHQINEGSAISATLYDSVSSFGRGIINDLDALPTSFTLPRNQLIGGPNGCVFGNDPGTGTCFDDSLQSITSANFRNRGLSVLYSRTRGVWDFGVGANYARRNYLTSDNGNLFTLADVTDETAGIQASLGRNFTRNSGVDFNAYAQWNSSGLFGSSDIFATGVTGTYYRTFGERLQGNASLGLYNTSGGQFDSTVAAALFGLRYGF